MDDGRGRLPTLLPLLLLAAAAFAAFGNTYRHAYNLDDGHLLLENSWVRSLGNIPAYFRDPFTLTALRTNADYRPVLQVTYALNYRWSGYETWSWHLVQILLHLGCMAALFLFARRLIRLFHPEAPSRSAVLVPLGVSLLYTVHPVTSGVVNYFSARSSLLTAAFLLPAFVLHLGNWGPRAGGRLFGAASLYTLALFTKVEAVGGLAVFFLLDVLEHPWRRLRGEGDGGARGGFVADVLATLTRRELGRLWPFLAATLVYFAIRVAVMPDFAGEARHAADVDGKVYLATQLGAWWYYVSTWFAPVRLVADYAEYPVTRSLGHPVALLALGGWLAAAGVLALHYRRRPYLAVTAVAALALISPTSSILPLAEMVNEHRPYLPLALLSTVWLIPLGLFLAAQEGERRPPFPRALALGGILLLAGALFGLTRERNLVYLTEESYNLDIIRKAPSARSLNNYALTLRGQGKEEEAMDHFRRALAMAPNWHIIHTNLGIGYHRLGDDVKAREHYDRAVATETWSGSSLVWRGYFLLDLGRHAEALADFEKSLPLNREHYRIQKGIATAQAGLGNAEGSLAATRRCLELDPAQTELDIKAISTPFWLRADLWEKGLAYYREIDRLLPGRWWVAYNLGDLELKLGRREQADLHFAEAERLKSSPGAAR
jgi:tetratricopeptide (TPR) repeat protein